MKFVALLSLLLLAGVVDAQLSAVPAPKDPAPAPGPVAPPAPVPPPPVPEAAPALKLPPDAKVPATRDLLEITAETTADKVLWSVFFVDGRPVRFVATDKTLYVPTPEPGTTVLISAFAPGLVAQTSITVEADKPAPPPGPNPGPTPDPKPTPPPAVQGKLFVSMVYDAAKVTPQQAAVLNSAAIRKEAEATGGKASVVPSTDPFIAAKGLTADVAAAGLPCLVVQDASGAVRLKQALPATEAEALDVLRKLRGQ